MRHVKKKWLVKMIDTHVPRHTPTLKETSCKHYFIGSVFLRKSERFNPDFLLGERSLRSTLCVIGKVNGKQPQCSGSSAITL